MADSRRWSGKCDIHLLQHGPEARRDVANLKVSDGEGYEKDPTLGSLRRLMTIQIAHTGWSPIA